MGASSTVTGYFLATVYLSLALSNITAGWLSGRFRRRKLFLILGGALAVPAAWLMSQAKTVGGILALMGCLWFVTGISMVMVNILMGLSAEADHRGSSFGFLNLCASFGLFFGALVSGPIADRAGFSALFAAFAVFYLLLPIAGWFVQERRMVEPKGGAAVAGARHIFRMRTFSLLFAASILAQAANVMIFLTRPLIMNALHFDLTAISRASAIGSFVTLPLPLSLGWLTDRIGRKSILMACFLAPTLGLLVQIAAVDTWQFLVSSVLSTIIGTTTSVGSALMSDIFPEEARGTALSFLNATPWIGIVIGLSAGGAAIGAFQMKPALMVAVLLSLGGILLLSPVSEPRSEGPG
jgi:MFS family permease